MSDDVVTLVGGSFHGRRLSTGLYWNPSRITIPVLHPLSGGSIREDEDAYVIEREIYVRTDHAPGFYLHKKGG